MNKVEILLVLCSIIAFVVLWTALYEKWTSEKINLVKSDWECAKYEVLTTMQPISNGKTTSFIHIPKNICVSYERR